MRQSRTVPPDPADPAAAPDPSALRGAAIRVRDRLRGHAPTLLLASVAAGLAFLIAEAVFGPAQAVFAPIAAVVATGLSAGQRRRRALEISIGVVLGIAAADLLSRWVGIGPWQLGAAVLLATTAAVAFRASGLLSNQAAVAAVVVMTLVPLLDTGPWVRLGDALIGGAVAVVLSTVFSPATFRTVSAVADRTLSGYADILAALRSDLADGSLAGAEQRLEQMESLATAQQELEDASAAARERLILGGATTRERHRHTLETSALLGRRVVLLLTSGRALCRAGANLVRHGRPVEPALLEAVDGLVETVTALRGWIAGGAGTGGKYDDDEVRALALAAAATASELYDGARPPTVIVAVGQLRSAVVDVLRITGLSQAEAVSMLEDAAGRADP